MHWIAPITFLLILLGFFLSPMLDYKIPRKATGPLLVSGLLLLLASTIFAIAPLTNHDAVGFSVAGVVFSFLGLLLLLIAGTRMALPEDEKGG